MNLTIAATRERLMQEGASRALFERVLLLLSMTASIVYLASMPWHPFAGQLPLKVFAILPLAILPLLVSTAPRRWLLTVALLASLCGDIVLIFPGPIWFMRGLLSFLVAHILYIYLFSRRIRPALRLTADEIMGLAFLVAVPVSALAWLWPRLGAFRLPVLVYATALTSINLCALLAKMPGVFLGTLLFLLSDTLLGIKVFHHALPGGSAMVWITYYLAQLLIVLGYLTPTRTLSNDRTQ